MFREPGELTLGELHSLVFLPQSLLSISELMNVSLRFSTKSTMLGVVKDHMKGVWPPSSKLWASLADF